MRLKGNSMTDVKDYTFYLMPGGKTRYIAGPFDINTRLPHYEIEISVPTHVRDQIEVNQFLLGTPENCQWAWDIKNNTSWPTFIIIRKNGEKI